MVAVDDVLAAELLERAARDQAARESLPLQAGMRQWEQLVEPVDQANTAPPAPEVSARRASGFSPIPSVTRSEPSSVATAQAKPAPPRSRQGESAGQDPL